MKTAMDLHIEELLDQYRSITTGVHPGSIPYAPTGKVDMSIDAAASLLSKRKDEAEKDSNNEENMIDMCGGEASNADGFINRELFHKGITWTDGQKKAADYILDKLDKSNHNEQLLMLLHGPPGIGKTFLIERLQKVTNIKMRITKFPRETCTLGPEP